MDVQNIFSGEQHVVLGVKDAKSCIIRNRMDISIT